MNYVGLVSRLATECGVSGTITTAQNLVGEQARLANWVGTAWNELQTQHDDWEFLRSSNLLGLGASFPTIAGQGSYPLGTTSGTCGIAVALFGKWDRDSFRCYTTSAGTNDEQFLDSITYDAWRNVYQLGANRAVQTRPVAVAVGPDESVCLGPSSNGLYTVTADYFVAPTAMVADIDVPTGLPAQFHMAIVYKAMTYYGGYEAAPEVSQRGMAGYAQLLAQLEALRSPEISFAGALC